MKRALHAIRDRIDNEQGWAMTWVVGLALIVLILLTTAIGVAEYEATSTGRQQRETKSMHLADAGLNQYLYGIRTNPGYYSTTPSLGPVVTEDGTWTVQAQAPTQTTPLTLVAVGVSGQAKSRTTTITAQVRYPTFADFSFITNADIDIGSAAHIYGKVHANGYVNNAGTCHDEVTAAGDVRGGGQFLKGFKEYQPSVDFNTVTTDMSAIKQVAQSSGSYFGPTTNPGYYIQLNGANYSVYYVTGGTTTGNLTMTSIGSYAIPARGVVYFDDNVWVDGSLSGRLTIATSEVMYIKNNIDYGTSTSALGLIAQRNIAVLYWYPSSPQNLTVKGALLSQTADISADFHSGVWRSSFTFVGSMGYATHSGFYRGDGGYSSRSYTYDANLDTNPPPMFPVIHNGNLKVSSWLTTR